jgi:Flp pilus assembly protein TadG
VLIYLLFGILEYSLVFRSYLTLGNGLRAAGRTAAIVGNDTDADWRILQAAKKEMAAMQASTISRIVIFDATPASGSSTPKSVPAGCMTAPRGADTTNHCNVYVPSMDWASNAKSTDYACNTVPPNTNNLAAGFCPADREVKVSGPPDVVGIYIEVQHPFLSRIFGSTKKLSDTQFAAIEPRSA